jgi:hypothetical protein
MRETEAFPQLPLLDEPSWDRGPCMARLQAEMDKGMQGMRRARALHLWSFFLPSAKGQRALLHRYGITAFAWNLGASAAFRLSHRLLLIVRCMLRSSEPFSSGAPSRRVPLPYSQNEAAMSIHEVCRCASGQLLMVLQVWLTGIVDVASLSMAMGCSCRGGFVAQMPVCSASLGPSSSHHL